MSRDPRIAYTPEMDDIIRQGVAKGLQDAEIARSMRVSKRSVESRRKRIGLAQVSKIWSPERRDEAEAHFHAGLSASQAAARLGVTRNAVIGVWHRLGLSLTPQAREAKQQAEAARRSANAQAARERQKAREARHRLRPVKVNAVSAPKTPSTEPVLSPNAKVWTERRFGECTFPVAGEGADLQSCCNPAVRAGYCAGHYRIAWRPAPKLRPYSDRNVIQRRAA